MKMGMELPDRREKILTRDAHRDIDNELQLYFESQHQFLDVLSTEQKEELYGLEEQERDDIRAFLVLAQEENIPVETSFTQDMTPEVARGLMYRSGSDSLYAIARYLDSDPLDSPQLMYFARHVGEYADASVIPLFVSYLRDDEMYEIHDESGSFIELICAAFEEVVRNIHISGSPTVWLVDVADQLTEILKSAPNSSENINRILAVIGGNIYVDDDSSYDEDYDYDNDYDDPYSNYDDHYSSTQHYSGEGLKVNLDTYEGKIGWIDFTPAQRTYYSPDRRTEFLNIGFNDFKEFLEAMDSGSFVTVETLKGTTNREMARAALILGFNIEEDYSGYYKVTGSIKDIRERLAILMSKQFRGKKLFEKIQERAERQMSRRQRYARF